MRIVFVACNRNRSRFLEDPSFLYRCENLAAALRTRGHETQLLHMSRLAPWLSTDVVVFHRPHMSLRLRALLSAFGRRGVRLVADVDDLIFDEALAEFSPGVRNHLIPLEQTRTMFAANRQALAAFEMITVSTAALSEEAGERFPGSRIGRLPNAVHHSWRDVDVPMTAAAERPPVITYLPGTRSHDRDFASVTPVLERLLVQHAELRLHITGRLEFEVNAQPGQIRHGPRVHFSELYPIVRDGWLNIAPLEPTPFTRCKSALKVIEAGFWGIPTVCSPLPDADRFADAGALRAHDADDWHAQVEQMLEPGHYAAATAGLRERILAEADVHAVAGRFLDFVEGKRLP